MIHDAYFIEKPAPPRLPAAPIDCSTVDNMLALGARHLKEQALCDLADHLDICVACGTKFDALCPEETADQDANAPTPAVDLGSRLVKEVLEHLEGLRSQKLQMKLIRHQPSVPPVTLLSDCDGQLARGQVLRGKSHRFVLEARIGFGDFTETYTAKQVLGDGAVETNGGMRAVIKIPRIAEDMSSDAAIDRLRLLRSLIQVHAQELENLAGLREVAGILDCGEYVHRLRDRETNSTFVAYEYVDGVDLASYMVLHHSVGGQFCGLPTAADFAGWVRMLAHGMLEIHNRLAIHGDICPSNVLVTPEGRPVFIDVGQSLFREVMNGAKAFNGDFYRAPEGIGTPGSDLFSMGGLLYFLATGQEPIGFAHADREALKQQIAFRIKEVNPGLYQDDAGVADIIAMCLRKDDRVQHAGRLLREIDAFWPGASASIMDDLRSLTDVAAVLDTSGNSVYLAVAASQVRSLRRTFTDMTKEVFDADGSGPEIRFAAAALLGALGAGDEFLTVSVPPFWYPDNIGINGRFLSNCRNAAARGASIKRVFLLDENLSDPCLEQIVAAHLAAVNDLDSSLRSNFAVRYLLMSAERRRKLVAIGRHFGLLITAKHRIAMWPVYDAKDALVTLRFRSGPRHVEDLREKFEEAWSESRPLVDLRLRTDLDVLEKAG